MEKTGNSAYELILQTVIWLSIAIFGRGGLRLFTYPNAVSVFFYQCVSSSINSKFKGEHHVDYGSKARGLHTRSRSRGGYAVCFRKRNSGLPRLVWALCRDGHFGAVYRIQLRWLPTRPGGAHSARMRSSDETTPRCRRVLYSDAKLSCTDVSLWKNYAGLPNSGDCKALRKARLFQVADYCEWRTWQWQAWG